MEIIHVLVVWGIITEEKKNWNMEKGSQDDSSHIIIKDYSSFIEIA